MKSKLVQDPDPNDLETISRGIKTFNRTHIPDEFVFEPDTRFVVFARNNNDEVVGGIRAVAFWNYCTLELVWLSDETWRQGVGSALIARAESFGKDSGFEFVRTETTSFQARPFYEKLGHTVFGELPDCPKGHTTYCLAKQL
jgi:GNAT superfamily N-acetyltransferase